MDPHYASRRDNIIKMAHRISFVFRDTLSLISSEISIMTKIMSNWKQLLDAKPLY